MSDMEVGKGWDERLYWARCKLGPERSYWVVGVLCEPILIADGYCKSVGEAEVRAKERAGPDAIPRQAYLASRWHRRKVHEARKDRISKGTGAEIRTFVYQCDFSEWDGHRYAVAYPVLKRTKKRFFVGMDGCSAEVIGTDREPSFHHGPEDRTFVLDRAALEADGRAWSRPMRGYFYLHLEDTLDPSGGRLKSGSTWSPSESVVEALAVLGLSWPCSREDVRAAYRRRSLETHPDRGGSETSFVEIAAANEVINSSPIHWPVSTRPEATCG